MSLTYQITIDGRSLQVLPGSSVLEAASSIGVDIPTLCHLPDYGPHNSCMLCVVQDAGNGNLFPSCSAKVVDDMVVDTTSDAVHQARKTALELLLSDHQGECEAPCQTACPAGLDIPRIFCALQLGKWQRAFEILQEVPWENGEVPCTACRGICGRVCRRNKIDEGLRIRGLMMEIARRGDLNLEGGIQGSSVKKVMNRKNTGKNGNYRNRLGRGASDYYRKLEENCGALRELPSEVVRLKKGVQSDPVDEATRCLLCGCAVANDCRLRYYATIYGATGKAFGGALKLCRDLEGKGSRHNNNAQNSEIIRESGKCIQCGICIRLTAAQPGEGESDKVVMGYRGRGFEMTVEPAHFSGESHPGAVPERCIDQCPTGALAWRDRSRK